jgi:hypothetical protein
MTPFLSSFKSVAAALVLALGLGAVAMPAMAQDAPPSGFTLNVPGPTEAPPVDPNTGQAGEAGNAGDMSTFRQGYYDEDEDDFYYCLEDREIIRALRDYGFERVRIVRYLRGERVEVTAYWGRYQYSMRVDRCTGVVDRVRLIRRSGFGLQFNFSN